MTRNSSSRSRSATERMGPPQWTSIQRIWLSGLLGITLLASSLSPVEAVPMAKAMGGPIQQPVRTVTITQPPKTTTVGAKTIITTQSCLHPSTTTRASTQNPTTASTKPNSTSLRPRSTTSTLKTTATIPASTITTTFTFPSSSSSSTSASSTSAVPFYIRNINTIKSIYNLTIYPNQVPIIIGGGAAVPPGLFAPNATGRITPVGNFTDFEDSIEYFFALPPIPASNSNGAAFSHYWLPQFSSECPEVAASTVYLTASVADPKKPNYGQVITYLKQTGFWRFNDRGEVINYDLDLIQLEDFTERLTSTNFGDPFSQRVLIAGLCQQTQQRCTGPNQQWNNVTQCVEGLSQLAFGTFNEVWSDTVVCRLVHILLTYVRPQIHCPHVGPTGGMKCVDYPYYDRVFNDQKTFGTNSAFRCPVGSVHLSSS